MPSTFPGALDNLAADKADNTVAAGDHATHHNAIANAINAVQTALGVGMANVEAAGAAASAVSAHAAAADPHPNYTTTAEAAAAAPVQSVAGRTGAVTLTKSDVGLGSVDNTSDANKPISTATQTALNGKASSSHTHLAADITDFSTAADARITASNKVASNITGITGADQITNIVSLTQAEYNAIVTKNASTLYVIAG
jgi:hypothetical protein